MCARCVGLCVYVPCAFDPAGWAAVACAVCVLCACVLRQDRALLTSVIAPTLYAYLVNNLFISSAPCTTAPPTCNNLNPGCYSSPNASPCAASISPPISPQSSAVEAVKAKVTALLLSVEGLATLPAPLDHSAVAGLAAQWVALDVQVMSPRPVLSGSYTPLNIGGCCRSGCGPMGAFCCAVTFSLGSPQACGSASYPSALFPSTASPQ
jgi:hypothetical protein